MTVARRWTPGRGACAATVVAVLLSACASPRSERVDGPRSVPSPATASAPASRAATAVDPDAPFGVVERLRAAARGDGPQAPSPAAPTSRADRSPSPSVRSPGGPSARADAAGPTGGPSVAAAPSPTAAPSPSPPPPVDAAARAALARRLTRSTDALPEGSVVSLVVLDPAGQEVFGLAPDRGLLPASTTKLLTGAAALAVFGPEHRLTTTVRRDGPLVEGTVEGSLVLVGGGDPVLATDDYHTLVYLSRPHTPIQLLADRVAARGVTRVRSGVAIAPDRFGGFPVAVGWKDDYLPLLEARPIRALTVDGGLAVTVVEPAPDPVLQILPVDDPRLRTGELFARALGRAGVELVGGPRPLPPRLLAADVEPGALPVVASVESPPLREIVRFAFERSDNHISDTLFRLVGAERGAVGWGGAGDAVVAELRSLGVDTTGLRLTDGSGLSRAHAVSARHLAAVDRAMRAGEWGRVWRDALAVAGEEGTLRRRLRGTVAEGRFLGKTGTLDDVTAIAGTVEGPDGEAAYHVAAIANLPPSVGRWGAVTVFDDVIALLAEQAAGCERVPSAGASPSPGEAPVPGDDGTPAFTVRCP